MFFSNSAFLLLSSPLDRINSFVKEWKVNSGVEKMSHMMYRNESGGDRMEERRWRRWDGGDDMEEMGWRRWGEGDDMVIWRSEREEGVGCVPLVP